MDVPWSSVKIVVGGLVHDVVRNSIMEARIVRQEEEQDTQSEPHVLTREDIQGHISDLGLSADACSQVFRQLDLESLSLTDIGLLSEYPHIQRLSLMNNSIQDLSALSSMTYLLSLNASKNALEHALAIPTPPAFLKAVDLSFNRISTVDMSPFVRLRSLNLETIEGLDQCIYLEELRLSFNMISKIPDLSKIPLKQLALANNLLREFENVESLPRLEYLNLNNNMLDCLDGMECLTNLNTLLLENNKLSKMEALLPVCGITSLERLDLGGNLIENHRPFVLFRMPQLATLDGREVSCVEKVAAINSCNPPEEVVAAVDHTIVVAGRTGSEIILSTSLFHDPTVEYPVLALVAPSLDLAVSLRKRLVEEHSSLFSECTSINLDIENKPMVIASQRVLFTFRVGGASFGIGEPLLEELADRRMVPVVCLPLTLLMAQGVFSLKKSSLKADIVCVNLAFGELDEKDAHLFERMRDHKQLATLFEEESTDALYARISELIPAYQGRIDELKKK